MPANAPVRSAVKPAGPVTAASSPSPDVVGDLLAHGRDDLVDLGGGVDLHEDLERLAVVGLDRRRHAVVDDAVDVLERRRVLGDGVGVGVRQAAVTCVDHDRRDHVVGAESGLQVLHLRRLGVGRQELRLLVLDDVAERSERGAARAERGEPEQDEDGRDQDPEPSGHATLAGAGVGCGFHPRRRYGVTSRSASTERLNARALTRRVRRAPPGRRGCAGAPRRAAPRERSPCRRAAPPR